jgi:hypothetical protein
MRGPSPTPGIDLQREPPLPPRVADHFFGRVSSGFYRRLTDHWKERSGPLLVALLVLLGTSSWFDARFGGLPIFALLLTLVLVSSILRLSTSRRQTVVGVLLGAPAIVGLWLSELIDAVVVSQAALALMTFFLLYTTVTVLIYVLRDDTVDMETLGAAFSVFLLMGFTWGTLYGFLYLQDPQAFRFPEVLPTERAPGLTAHVPLDVLIYFSFVTLTTVGYGDVLPVASSSRALAMLEAVIGHFYLAILIGRLVGLSIEQVRKPS